MTEVAPTPDEVEDRLLIAQQKKTNIENAFDYLLNAIRQENLPGSRELSLVMTKIEEAQLRFLKTKVE